MAIPPIKKNDEVYILNGKDRGKTGRVLIVTPKKDRIGRRRPDDQAPHAAESAEEHQGRIAGKEAAIHIPNVAISKNCKKHTRIGSKILADGRTARTCKKCGNTIE
jgi:large subunit ribosomal protein L24